MQTLSLVTKMVVMKVVTVHVMHGTWWVDDYTWGRYVTILLLSPRTGKG
jgi:hypothetical protein